LAGFLRQKSARKNDDAVDGMCASIREYELRMQVLACSAGGLGERSCPRAMHVGGRGGS
jgi:hypothetical protein